MDQAEQKCVLLMKYLKFSWKHFFIARRAGQGGHSGRAEVDAEVVAGRQHAYLPHHYLLRHYQAWSGHNNYLYN